MNNYLFIDNESIIPLTTVIAEDDINALCKYIKGSVKDGSLTIKNICDDLNIELIKLSDLKNYE